MAFKNLMMTSSGMVLYAKAQQGKQLRFSRIAVGDGLLGNGESMVNRSVLKSERASFLIDHVQVSTSSSAAEILTTMRNDDLTEGFYFRELGICAIDPDTQDELLCFYDNAGEDGEYIPAASENVQVVERLKMLIKLENTPNVSFVASGNPIYLTADDIDDDAQGPGVLWSAQKINAAKQDKLTGTAGQVVGFNAEGVAVPKPGVGRSMAGQTVEPVQGETVTAGAGAEIFNDYNKRTYSSEGAVTAGNVASGDNSHAEGRCTTASGKCSHTEGLDTFATGSWCCHAEGWKSQATANYSHAEGYNTRAQGNSSHSEGSATVASSGAAHAEGDSTTASGNYGSHAEGHQTTASGISSHAEGKNTNANGNYSHSEGEATVASGKSSHAEGYETQALKWGAHAEGTQTVASGNFSHASGMGTIAHAGEFVIGSFNVDSQESDISISGQTQTTFIVGNGGGETTRANSFRVSGRGAYGVGAWNSSGADYAELFEWLDGNPDAKDRAGLFVTLEGDRLRVAGPQDDFILGIVSADPSVVGDVYDDQWAGMYLRDVFGRTIMEMQDFPAETTQVPREDGAMETVELIPARRELAPKLNPAYDHTVKYLPRTQRPEWDAVGMMGKLVAVDDGTCQVNGWCAVGEGGKATHSDARTRYRVMARLDETHIRVLIL